MMKSRYLLLALCLVAGLVWIAPSPQSGQAAPGYSAVHRTRVTVTTTGAAGSASGSATTRSIITGRVVRVDVDYATGITTTTDLTLTGGNDLIATNIASLTDTATDTQLFPTVQLTDNAGTGRTYDGTRPVVDYYPVSDRLTVTLAQSTANAAAARVDIYFVED